jgi:hypothetical protein
MRAKHKTEFQSVFILKMRYSSEPIKYPTQLQCDTLAYFSDLKKAESFITSAHKELYWFFRGFPFKIFLIEEYGLNSFLQDIRVRIYESNGNFYGEHLSDSEKNFQGREPEDCKFKRGDFIEYIDRVHRLNFGVIIGFPFSHRRVKEISKKASKKHILDSSDDAYLIVYGLGIYDYENVQVFYVFEPSGKIPEALKRQLTIHYQKYYEQISTEIK